MEAKIKEIIVEKIKDYDIKDYEPNRDLNELVEIFEKKLNWPKEQIVNNFETIFKNKDSYPVHLIIRDKGKIVSRVLIFRDLNNPKELTFGTLILEDEKYLNSILFEISERIKGLTVETISIVLWNEIFTMEQKFKSFGFYRKGKISYYEKEI